MIFGSGTNTCHYLATILSCDTDIAMCHTRNLTRSEKKSKNFKKLKKVKADT